MLPLLGLALLLVLTAYISTLTYVLRSYSRPRLMQRIPENQQRAWLDWLDAHDSELLLATGVMRLTACAGMVLATFAIWQISVPGPEIWAAAIAPALVSIGLISIAGSAVPHALATHVGEATLSRNLAALRLIRVVMWPIARPLLGLERLVGRIAGKPAVKDPETESERIEQEILDAVNEGELQGAVDEEQTEIIRSVFELRNTTVSEIMTPRTEIVALAADARYADVRRAMFETGHSRIPVYEDSLDQIVGVMYIKDLLLAPSEDKFEIRKQLRRVPFVPETKPVAELLEELRRDKVHMAIALDEYGGTAGVITIEDILEELVGEIADEYDRKVAPAIRRVDDSTLEVDGRVHVHEVNSELAVTLPEAAEYDTISGFVFSTLGKIPASGEEFTHENVHFRVVDAEPRKINRLRIRVVREQQPA